MVDSERIAELAKKTEDYMKSISKFNYGLYKAASAKSPTAALLFPFAMAGIIGAAWVVGEFSVLGCYAALGLGTVSYLAQPFTLPIYCKSKGSKIGTISNIYPFYESLKQSVKDLEKVEKQIQSARTSGNKQAEIKAYWKKARILDYIETVGEKCFNNLEKCRDKSKSQKNTNRLFDASYFVDCTRSDVSKVFDKCAVDINTLETGGDVVPERKEKFASAEKERTVAEIVKDINVKKHISKTPIYVESKYSSEEYERLIRSVGKSDSEMSL